MADHRIAVRGGVAPRPGAAVVRLWLLGGFRASVGPRVVADGRWRLRKAASLVKLLALAPGHRMHRERVTALLWPNLGARPAANNLHRTLHFARGVIRPDRAAPPLLTLRGDLVELCPRGPLWVDVGAFEDAAAVARRSRDPDAYRAAVELYAGDLLPEDLYETWAEERRGELRRVHHDLLVGLAVLHEERGEYGPAIRAFERAATGEPADEVAQLGLMRTYAATGRRHEAMRRYERLRDILSRELGARPTDACRLLYEAIRAGKPPAAPSRRAVAAEGSATPNNLPVPLSSFVGRRGALLEVKRSLSMTRLLSLTGAGGSGKTRLALEVARDLLGAYPDGVWLAELAPLSDPSLAPRAVAAALGVREQPDHALTESVAGRIGVGRALLILDNCEHLVDAAARAARDLLSACPGLRILATSREALGVPGETVWPVPTLSLPDPAAETTVGDLMGSEAVQLFVQRARSRLPAFGLTPDNAGAVARICRELDGIPLAIELSTARMGALAVETVAERLEDSLKLLTGGDRTAPPRHRTLRATLDWSHGLLSEPERRLFARLSVFAGGWTLEAAEFVGAGSEAEGGDVLDLLARLATKSMVVVEADPGGGPRYGMLEPVRQYGRERLEAGGEAEEIRRRHASYYFGLAQKVEPWLRGGHRETWLLQLEGEYGNLRAALDWALESRASDQGLWFGAALAEFWYMSGDLGEARRWLEAALANGRGATPARARALVRAGWIAWEQGDYEGSTRLGEESLTLSREIGDEPGVVAALSCLAWAALLREDLHRASVLSEEAIRLGRALGDAGGVARALLVPGLAAVVRRDHARAVALHEESLRLARQAADGVAAALSLGTGVFAHLGLGDERRAGALCREGFELAPRPMVMMVTTFQLHASAALAGSRGQPLRSARLWGAAEALREHVGAILSPVERRAHEPHISAARAGIGDAAWREAWVQGRAMTAEEAVEYAVAEGEPEPRSVRRSKPRRPQAPAVLTRRQQEVAALVADGLTNREIAAELAISENTAANHVAGIIKRLRVPSRSRVAVWVTETGLSRVP